MLAHEKGAVAGGHGSFSCARMAPGKSPTASPIAALGEVHRSAGRSGTIRATACIMANPLSRRKLVTGFCAPICNSFQARRLPLSRPARQVFRVPECRRRGAAPDWVVAGALRRSNSTAVSSHGIHLNSEQAHGLAEAQVLHSGVCRHTPVGDGVQLTDSGPAGPSDTAPEALVISTPVVADGMRASGLVPTLLSSVNLLTCRSLPYASTTRDGRARRRHDPVVGQNTLKIPAGRA